MILVDGSTIAAHRAEGLWGRVTLDALLTRHAEANPDRIALADAPDRARWTPGEPRRWSYAQAAAEIARFAAALHDLGLRPDAVVGLQLPNTTDALLLMLAGLRAGLVLAPLSPLWGRSEIVEALAPFAPQALIGASCIGETATGLVLAEAAAGLFSVRHVAVLDREAPDGVLPLADYAPFAEPPAALPDGADHVASLAWGAGAGGPVAARSHNQWIANGLMALLAARMDAGSRILSPLLLCNSAAFAAAVAPWLLTGATLILQHPFAASGFAAVLEAERPSHLLLPGPVAQALAPDIGSRATLIRVWNGPEAAAPADGCFDLLRLGEAACVVPPSADPLLLGPVRIGAPGGPVFCELGLDAAGRLLLQGAIASSDAAPLIGGPAESDPWRDTGWLGRAAADGSVEMLRRADPERPIPYRRPAARAVVAPDRPDLSADPVIAGLAASVAAIPTPESLGG